MGSQVVFQAKTQAKNVLLNRPPGHHRGGDGHRVPHQQVEEEGRREERSSDREVTLISVWYYRLPRLQ